MTPRLQRLFPILAWAPHYTRAEAVNDLFAALIVTIMLVPQSLAYAMLAGLPPVVGQTGMRIFCADPHSSWQRGTNEYTNGLLLQYLPKGSSLAGWDQDDLDLRAASLNDRPRKTLDYATPKEAINSLVAKPASGGETTDACGVATNTESALRLFGCVEGFIYRFITYYSID